ncbi:MAG TPA: ABC transporter permease [Longimicrobiales bacterium]|nr:ABC transporter permease [Longimicrobiales bacterium]
MRIANLGEGILLALDQLRANKFRSALTIVGVVIGVATVMAMSSMVTGIRSEALSGLEAAGPENFMLMRYDVSQVRVTNEHGPPWGNNPKVTVAEIEHLRTLPGVRDVIASMDMSSEMQTTGAPVSGVQISANSAGWDEFTMGTFSAGHNFLPSDVKSSRQVVVLSRALADKLFGSLDPLNRLVKIRGIPFQVIGIFEREANIFGEASNNFAVVPYTTAIKVLRAWDGMLGALVVTAQGTSQVDAMDQVIGAMRTMRGLRPAEPNDFAVIRQQALLDMFNQITGLFFAVMIGLSSVALLVGGVGVIAIMMISVTERTREIGVRKAIGATRREILWQFLFEATTLTLAGGAAGMVIGGAVAWLIQKLTPIPASVPLWAVVAALLMAVIAGVAFGMAPAWRASRMDPVEALRYE